MKNLKDPHLNRTRNLPACSAVPEPTAPPRNPSKGVQSGSFKFDLSKSRNPTSSVLFNMILLPQSPSIGNSTGSLNAVINTSKEQLITAMNHPTKTSVNSVQITVINPQI